MLGRQQDVNNTARVALVHYRCVTDQPILAEIGGPQIQFHLGPHGGLGKPWSCVYSNMVYRSVGSYCSILCSSTHVTRHPDATTQPYSHVFSTLLYVHDSQTIIYQHCYLEAKVTHSDVYQALWHGQSRKSAILLEKSRHQRYISLICSTH